MLAALGITLGACDSGDVISPPPCAPGTPQIVLNECVFGITIDSDSADVVARLGPPDYYGLDSEGFGFRIFRYDDHPEAGRVSIYMVERGFFYLYMSEFSIRTASGIGSGTRRAEVRQLLGEPLQSNGAPSEMGFDFYYSEADSVGVSFWYDGTEAAPVVGGFEFQSRRRGLFDTPEERQSVLGRIEYRKNHISK